MYRVLQFAIVLSCLAMPNPLCGQAADPAMPASIAPVASAEPHHSVERSFIPNLFRDQRDFWLGPKQLDLGNAQDLVLLGGAVAALFATDRSTMSHHFQDPTLIKRSGTLANGGALAMGTATAG